jgi:hypothetical protein
MRRDMTGYDTFPVKALKPLHFQNNISYKGQSIYKTIPSKYHIYFGRRTESAANFLNSSQVSLAGEKNIRRGTLIYNPCHFLLFLTLKSGKRKSSNAGLEFQYLCTLLCSWRQTATYISTF